MMMNRLVGRAAYSVNRSLVNTVKYSKQDQLYLHQFNNELTSISFSSDPNKLHLGTVKTGTSNDISNLKISVLNFIENKEFLPVLHQAFSDNVYNDQTYIYDAMNYPDSFMAIGDYKVILDYMNQRPELANTVGFVHVNSNCIMDNDSYEKNDMYTLCNIDGVIKLSEYMSEQLQRYL